MKKHTARSISWSRFLRVCLLVTLVGGGLPWLPTVPPGASRIQPALLALVAAQPQATARVIVQKSGQSHQVEQIVARLGGVVTTDLSIINGFAATLPAHAVEALASAPGVRWVALDGAVTQAGHLGERAGHQVSSDHFLLAPSSDTREFTTWASKLGTVATTTFQNPLNIISPLGRNGTYGSGGNARGAFAGFAAEVSPGYRISKVEVVLHSYIPIALSLLSNIRVTPYVNNQRGQSTTISAGLLNLHIGLGGAGLTYVDVTSSRSQWQWSDFQTLELLLEQSGLLSTIYYDAIGVRVTSVPGEDPTGVQLPPATLPAIPIPGATLANTYYDTTQARAVWNDPVAPRQGAGVTVAVVDSGILDYQQMGGTILPRSSRQNSSERCAFGALWQW